MKNAILSFLAFCLCLGACRSAGPASSLPTAPASNAASEPSPTPAPTALPIAQDEYLLVSVQSLDVDGVPMAAGMLNRSGILTSFATEADNVVYEDGFDQLEVGQVVTVQAGSERMSYPGQLVDVSEVHVLRQGDEDQVERALAVYHSWQNGEANTNRE